MRITIRWRGLPVGLPLIPFTWIPSASGPPSPPNGTLVLRAPSADTFFVSDQGPSGARFRGPFHTNETVSLPPGEYGIGCGVGYVVSIHSTSREVLDAGSLSVEGPDGPYRYLVSVPGQALPVGCAVVVRQGNPSPPLYEGLANGGEHVLLPGVYDIGVGDLGIAPIWHRVAVRGRKRLKLHLGAIRVSSLSSSRCTLRRADAGDVLGAVRTGVPCPLLPGRYRVSGDSAHAGAAITVHRERLTTIAIS